MRAISNATPMTRLVSGSNSRSSRNGVMGMGAPFSQAGAQPSLSHRRLDQCVVGDSGSLRPIVLWLCPVGDLSASLFPNVALRNSPDRPIPPSEAVLFCRHGHAIIALRKLPQLFATGW